MADGQVLIEITADNRGVKQTLKDTTTDLQHAGQQWEQQGDKMSGVFGKIAGAITAAGIGKALLGIGKEAVEAASSLAEVQNVVDVTFGNSAKEIDSWAKSASKNFGLTETQAKQFASTIGAMAKSSGVASSDLVGMSEDLAGLAADMASFYNLDFDTAFQKIRSGISGETEPLKQLGINMSVVNLEAYAMTQGITKSFNEMSQGEQTMLRYQYLMQATADAQGDFARTSDGFANASRKFESSLDSLKAKLGGPIMEGLAAVLGTINDIYEKLFDAPQKRHTIMDTFAEIDEEASAHISEVKQTAEDARALVGILLDLNANGFTASTVSAFADGANRLDASSPFNWESLLTAFHENTPGDMTWLGNSTQVSEMAAALSGISSDQSKQDAWMTMLYALSENADGIARMTGTDPQTVRNLLAGIASQAMRIDEDDAQAWDDLLTVLATSFPGLITSDTLAALGTSLGGIALAGNNLRSSSSANWTSFLQACEGIDGLTNIWDGTPGGLNSLADALATGGITQSRAQAWQTMLGALKDNISVVSGLHNASESETAAWLDTLANAANQLDPNSADGWDKLFTWLVQGLPDLGSTPEGQALLDALNNRGAQGEVTRASTDAVDVMEMLGVATADVNDQQSLWLATCRSLVQMIPSLGRIINTTTGEILGGAQAVRDYIDAWEEDNIRQIYINALREKISEYNALVRSSQTNATASRAILRAQLGDTMTVGDVGGMLPAGATLSRDTDTALDEWSAWIRAAAESSDAEWMLEQIRNYSPTGSGRWHEMAVAYHNMNDRQRAQFEEWIEAEAEAGYQAHFMPIAAEVIEEDIREIEQQGIDAADALAEAYGDASEEATIAARELSEEQVKGWEATLQAVADAAAAVDEYRRATVEATRQTLRSWGNLFDEIESNDDRIRREIEEDLADFEGDRDVEFNIRIGTSDIRTANNMLANLQRRAAYLEHYGELMQQAKDLGYSPQVLAQLADGSMESYDMLVALVAGGASYVDDINAAYATVQTSEQELAETLSEYQLQADETFQGLVDALSAAMNTLDAMVPTDAPAIAVGDTIEKVLDVINRMYPQLSTSVARVQYALGQLGVKYGAGVTVSGGHAPGYGGFRIGIDGKHANGLDYVPFDGYIGQLHRGEAVLTAQEAQIWREFRSGIDANSLAGAIWDNSPDMGGNVYLNGEIVGRIMSGVQADSYRQLERSGWRG